MALLELLIAETVTSYRRNKMLAVLILGGVAATYLHKKFPKTTEAVAPGDWA